MKKISFSFITCLIFFTSFLHSCTKEQFENDFLSPNNPDQVNIDKAKLWFEKTVLTNTTNRMNNDNNGYLYYDWSNASVIISKKGEKGVIAPIFDTKKQFTKEGDWAKVKKQAYNIRKLPNVAKALYIYLNKNGKEEYRFLTYIPDTDTKSNEKFSGYIISTDINDNIKTGYVFKNGVAIKRIAEKGSNNKTNYECGEWANLEWTTYFADGSGINLHRKTVYFPRDCQDNGNTPNINTPIDIDVPGPEGGYGASIPGTNVAEIDFNNLKNDCFKSTLLQLVSQNYALWGNEIYTIFRNFGVSKDLNITFDNAPLDSINIDGRAGVAGLTNVNITLNDNALLHASKEYVAVTILHEVLHAHFDLGTDPNLKFETIQHDVMSQKYIEPLATYLNRIYLLPIGDARALAWGGLGKTQAWTSKSSNDRTNIAEINNKHKNLNNANNAPGTHCP